MKKIFLSLIFAGSVLFYSCENKETRNENLDDTPSTEMEDSREYDVEESATEEPAVEQDVTDVDTLDVTTEDKNISTDTTSTL